MLRSWGTIRVTDGVEIDEEADIDCDDYTGWDHLWGMATDNGANLLAAVERCPPHVLDGSIPCIPHTVQLSVNSGRSVE